MYSAACVHVSSFSRVQLSVTQWTLALQPTLSMGFSWPEYWSGLPFPPPEDLPDPGIELMSPADFLPTEPCGKCHSTGYVDSNGYGRM